MSTCSTTSPGPTVLSVALTLLAASIVVSSISIYCVLLSSSLPPNAPRAIEDESVKPLIGPSDFWYKRYTWWKRALSLSQGRNFLFTLGHSNVVGMVEKEAVRTHFESKELDFTEGFTLLTGTHPPSGLRPIRMDGKIQQLTFSQYFKKRTVGLLRREYLQKILPHLITDVQARLSDLPSVTNPFDSIYSIIWQLSMRTIGFHEIVEDRALLVRSLHYLEAIDSAVDPLSLTYLRLPTPTRIKQMYYSLRTYLWYKDIIEKRRKTGARKEDAVQVMMDQGDTTYDMVTILIGGLFAAQFNSGLMTAWAALHLASQSDLLDRARNEVAAACDKYAIDKDQPLPAQLATLPLEAWEKEFPFLDAVLRETIRLHMHVCPMRHGSTFRRNVSGHNIPLGNGEVVPDGAWTTYHLAQTFLDPAIYSSPLSFDPDRFSPERAEDQKGGKNSYLGWGTGVHPCLGMKFAKLETNILLAFLITKHDIHLVEADGTPTERLPEIDHETWAVHKVKDPVSLRLSERV